MAFLGGWTVSTGEKLTPYPSSDCAVDMELLLGVLDW